MRSLKGYSTGYVIYLMVFLGLMSAFGPWITDMYLPSLPAMTREFATTPSQVQVGITASLLGLAAGQIFFGPISDKTGRKPIMIWSLIIFAIATIGDIYSDSIDKFNIFRFFQGFGGAGGIVLSRSVATDCYIGKELTKTMAIIGAINGIAPVVAPVAGGYIADLYGWKGVFWCLFLIGLILMILTLPFIESLEKEYRNKGNIKGLYGNYLRLMASMPFIKCITVFGLANVILFSYISSAPFIVQNIFGFSDTQFALFFALNACAIIIGSALSIRFKNIKSAILTGTMIMLLLSIILLINSILWKNFVIYEAIIWMTLFSLGLIFPSITTLAMNHGRFAIGAASALVGASGFISGGIISPLSGLGNILLPSAITMLSSVIIMVFFAKKIS